MKMTFPVRAVVAALILAAPLAACGGDPETPAKKADEHGDEKGHDDEEKGGEGQTRISAEAARAGGIGIAVAGPARIGETRELFGTVELDPSARSEIRAQFPGRVVSVTKRVGDSVRRGELLARIESSESLQVYPVHASVGGIVAERNANPGDVTGDRALFVLTN